MFQHVRRTVERLLDSEVTAHHAVEEGGYSPTGRWLVRLSDGRSAFVKAELEWSDRHGLSVEHRVYSSVTARCLPSLLGYDAGGDGAARVLVTEDLSGARWGTPLRDEDVTLFVAALDELAGVVAPDGIQPIDFAPGWAPYVVDAAPLVATGLVDADWAARYVPVLAGAEREVDTSGDRLLHTDLWLQNWCRADRGAVLVDWAGANAGSASMMRAFGEAAVRAAGGPAGLVLDGDPAWAAWMAGIAASYLAEQHPDSAPRLLETERREALACLRWACAELGLPVATSSSPFTALGPWRP